MQDELKRKQRLRFDLLRKVYELADGDTDKYVSGKQLSEAVGLEDVDQLRAAINYLEDEHLVNAQKMSGGIPVLIRLEHPGLREVEDAVSQPDKPTEHFMPINVLYVNQMIGSAVQQGTIGSSQSVSVSKEGVAEVTQFVSEVERHIEQLGLDEVRKREAKAELETIKIQAESPNPKGSVIKECLGSLRRILESAVGSALGSQLATQVPGLLALFT